MSSYIMTDQIYAIRNKAYLERIYQGSDQYWKNEVSDKVTGISCEVFETIMHKLIQDPDYKTLRQDMRFHDSFDYCLGLQKEHLTKLFHLCVYGGEQQKNLMTKKCFQRVLACVFRPIEMSDPGSVACEPKRLHSVIDLIYHSLFEQELKDSKAASASVKPQEAQEKENKVLGHYIYFQPREEAENFLQKTNRPFILSVGAGSYGYGLNLILSTRSPKCLTKDEELLSVCPGPHTESTIMHGEEPFLSRRCTVNPSHNSMSAIKKIHDVEHDLLITCSPQDPLKASFRNSAGEYCNNLAFLENDIKRVMQQWVEAMEIGIPPSITTPLERYKYRLFGQLAPLPGPLINSLNALDLRHLSGRASDFWHQCVPLASQLWRMAETQAPDQMTLKEFLGVTPDFIFSDREVYNDCRAQDLSSGDYRNTLEIPSLERLFCLKAGGKEKTISIFTFLSICATLLLPDQDPLHKNINKEPYYLKGIIDLLYENLMDTPWQQLHHQFSRSHVENEFNGISVPDKPTFGFMFHLPECSVTDTETRGLHLFLSCREPILDLETQQKTRHVRLTARTVDGVCAFIDRWGKPHRTLNFLMDDLPAHTNLWNEATKNMTLASLVPLFQKVKSAVEAQTKAEGLEHKSKTEKEGSG